MWLLLLFVLVPAVELYLLVRIGALMGVVPTIGLIIVTGMIGWILAKSQGISTLRRIRSEMAEGRVPALELVAGLCLLGAGLLLITPGFLTDLVGFLMLVPPLRRAVAGMLMKRFRLQVTAVTPSASGDGGEVIDVSPGDVKTYVPDEQGGHWV